MIYYNVWFIDLDRSFPIRLSLQKSASIPQRTNRLEFGSDVSEPTASAETFRRIGALVDDESDWPNITTRYLL